MKRFAPWALPFFLACLIGAAAPMEIEQKTHDSEYDVAEAFVYKSGKIKLEDVNHIRVFTTFAVPEKWTVKGEEVPLRKMCEQALPFVLNSVSGVNAEGFVELPKRVPDSDTLWYIDIRDFGWAEADIDAVFKLQPYFLTPLVDGKNPNMMFRADWFLVYATDNTKLDDRGIKDLPYYILQYGKGKEPKNKDEFEKAWRIDLKVAEKDKLETGTVIDKGDSGVSNHTRMLRRIRTILGYYWYTRDVKTHDIDLDKIKSRDYIEDLKALQADAGEYITSNKRSLQTYLLTAGTNQKFARVEAGDTGVVVDRQDPHDVRVRTAKSCMVCHSFGIIPYTNVVRELFQKGGKLLAYDKAFQRELKAFFLKYSGEEVKADNELFAKAIKDCNGLAPEENLKAYLSVYDWYWNTKVTLQQAAYETGLSVVEYKKAIKGATTGRLVFLYRGTPMPRDIWDSPNFGGYVQSMLFAKRIDKAEKIAPKAEKTHEQERKVVVTANITGLYRGGTEVLVYLNRDAVTTFIEDIDANWWYVRYRNLEGYLRKEHAHLVR